MKCGNKLKLISLITCVVFVFVSLPYKVSNAEGGTPLKDKFKERISREVVQYEGSEVAEKSYLMVKREYQQKGYQPVHNVNVYVELNKVKAENEKGISFEKGIGGKDVPVLVWNEDCEWVEWSVDVPESGLYEIVVEYYPLPGTGVDISRELMINGKVPFKEAHNITFSRIWQDEGEPKINAAGDEVIPRQKEAPRWRVVRIGDSEGLYSEPFKFYLNKGLNTIRINYLNQPIAIASITIASPDVIPTYSELKEEYEEKNYKHATATIKFQAEDQSTIKSSPTIRLQNDGDPLCEPRSLENVKLNVIGGSRWQSGNQWITWTFEVPEDGLYKIALRVGQWWGDGLPSYRQIAIDGKVPFEELREYKFEYSSEWRTEVLKDQSGQPYLFYLTKGTHELTMTVKLGPIGEVVQGLTEDMALLSDIILNITMITGENPDVNYEYDLHKRIPGLMDNLKKLSDSLWQKIEILDQISNRRLPVANAFESVKLQIDRMIDDPTIIPLRLGDLTGAQTNIGSWLEDLKKQPLIVDYIMILPPEEEVVNKKANIFQKLYTSLRIFISSFYKDYDNVSSVIRDEDSVVKVHTTIDVWVGMGREAAQLLKEIADSDFTPRTGIAIRMNILPSSQLQAGSGLLLLSIVSGKAPDVALGVSSDSPVEFAIRGAVKDLTQFEDFPEVYKRFLPGIMIPFEYEGGVYALPQTMGFTVLFYRKDILNKLGLSLPQTWDDVRNEILPILHQNKMNFATGNRLNVFGALLLQKGGSYYTEDRRASGLGTPEALQAFEEWTQLYTHYGVPITLDFYNRMRTGVTPIGIGGYDLYMKLLVAAPELLGKWDIALIPGTLKEDGTIDRSAVGGATGQAVMIMEQSKHPKAAWEFLKWWTSTETQVTFGREIEALLGPAARWNSANLEAFDSLPWNQEHIKIIKEQWKWNKEQPVVPGGYFTGRHLENAFTRVVMLGQSPRDSLEKAVEDIDKELKAKQEEFGIGSYRGQNIE